MNPGFGTYLTGTNTITGTTANIIGAPLFNGSPNNYTFDSLDGTFAFTKNGMGAITSGTSYILSGDSGGPTFESNGMGGLGLVGVHSFSAQHLNGMQEFNVPGDQWHDVNANQYAAFIRRPRGRAGAGLRRPDGRRRRGLRPAPPAPAGLNPRRTSGPALAPGPVTASGPRRPGRWRSPAVVRGAADQQAPFPPGGTRGTRPIP